VERLGGLAELNYLLDTHVWIWSLIDFNQLGSTTQSLLVDPQNVLFLSPISVWEALLLIERRRIIVHDEPYRWLETVLRDSALREAPLTHAIAIRSRTLSLPQQDPADRFIAATALEYNLTLITADQHLLNLAGLTTLPAR
jgi:PIN domain nuclease of toxin-antitoxin system